MQFSQQIFMHPYHQPQDHQQIEGQKRGADVVGDQAEYRGHQAAAHISGGHLYADHGLGPVCAKVLRCGVNDGRINGGAAKTGQDQPQQGSLCAQRQKHTKNAGGDAALPQTDHVETVVRLQRKDT